MSDNDPQASTTSDPPIIVHGGSVAVDVPDSFTDQGGKKFKYDKVPLDTLQINEDTPIKLNKGDTITITYK